MSETYTLEQAQQDFLKADAAAKLGNDAAKKDAVVLLKELERLEGQSPTARDVGKAGSFFSKYLGEPVGNVVKGIGEAIKGPEGLPDLPRFSPKTGVPSLKAALGTMINADPRAQIDIIKQQFPGVKITPVTAQNKPEDIGIKTPQDYYIAEWVNPETNETERGYINKPGLSGGDVSSAIGQGLIYGKTGVAKRALSVPGRVLETGVRSGATRTALDAGSELLGSKQGLSFGGTSLEAGIGAAFELASPALSKLWRAFRPNKSYWNPKNGQLTPLGMGVARRQGFDPDQMNDIMKREFFRLQQGKDVGSPFLTGKRQFYEEDVAGRAGRAAEFGVPLTKGASTKRYEDIALEDRMRKGVGGQGEIERQTMSAYDRELAESIKGAQRGLSSKVGLGRDETEATLADYIGTGLRRREAAAAKGVDDAYEYARTHEGRFLPEATTQLPGYIRKGLDNTIMTERLTPSALAAQKVVIGAVKKVKEHPLAKDYPSMPGPRTVYDPLSIQTLESTRKQLNGLWRGSKKRPEDRRAVRLIIDSYDKWIDDVMDAGLFKGDQGAIDALKRARELRTQYSRSFTNTENAAGKMVQDIWEKAQSPEEVVNYLMGKGQLGARHQAAAAYKKIRGVVGRDSEEWLALREMNWRRLSVGKDGELVSGRVFEKNLKTTLEQNGSAMKELYTPAEISSFKRFAKTYKEAYPDLVNPSQTAAAYLAKFGGAIRYTMRRIGQREAFVKGHIVTGSMWNFAARLPLNIAGFSEFAAKRLVKRQTSSLELPSGQVPWFTGTGTASMANYFNEQQ